MMMMMHPVVTTQVASLFNLNLDLEFQFELTGCLSRKQKETKMEM